MKVSINISNIVKSLKNSIRRFPVTIAISTTLVAMIILLSEKGLTFEPNLRDMLIRIDMIIALGIPLSVCIKFIYEKKNIDNKLHRILGYIFGAIILVIYFLIFLNDLSWINAARYVGISIFLYLAFFYIPWINRKEGYEHYIIDVLTSFFVTVIYSFVLFIGIVIMLFTIVQLFDVMLPDRLVFYTFLVIAGIFAIALFLSRLPKINKEYREEHYPKVLKVLLLYIVIPLITAYTIILYVYFIKIIITANWPQGLVSHLVLWYSVISVIVIFAITPILDDNKIALRFKSLFPKFILPILGMMFLAMWIRINSYGITENRYYGLILGIWVFGIMLYFSFNKKLKNMVIPVSLSVIALVSVFGPLSGFSISKLNQNSRFKSILERNQMLEGNKILSNNNLSQEDKDQMSMILQYFNARHSLKDVKYLPDDFEIGDMEAVLGFPFIEKDFNIRDNFYYYSEPKSRNIIDVNEYDYFIDSLSLIEGSTEFEGISVSYNSNNKELRILENDTVLFDGNLKTYANRILNEYDNQEGKYDTLLNQEDAIFVDENSNVKMKLIITSLSGEKSGVYNEKLIEHMEFYMFIKIK